MVDEGVAFLSASTVYRILKEARMVCPWSHRSKRKREEQEKASRPDQRWGTDLMYLEVGGRFYDYVGSLDEHSRYLVLFELLKSMDGNSVNLAAQRAIDIAVGYARGVAGEVGDPFGQWERVHVEGVSPGAGGESVDASEDQAALPGAEWRDGTE